MEEYCSTGQSPQWAVVPMEEEEEKEEEEEDFFEDERERAVTVTGPRYRRMLENFLGPELSRHPVKEKRFFPTRWSYEPHRARFHGSCEEFVS